MSKIKIVVAAAAVAIVTVLTIFTVVSFERSREWKKKYDEAMITQQAYIRNLSSAKNSIYQYSLTVDDLRHMNDSISLELVRLKEKLKIRDRDLSSMQYMYAHFLRIDTVTVSDTVFVSEDVCFDTVIGDEWMSTRVVLEYPGSMVIMPDLKSEKKVAVYLKRETVEAPKKTWIGRLFQRKHKVAKVYIDESNPYLKDQENEFIEIIR